MKPITITENYRIVPQCPHPKHVDKRLVFQIKTITIMKPTQVKEEIRKMKKYNIDKLNELSIKSNISLITINFWWNAIKN